MCQRLYVATHVAVGPVKKTKASPSLGLRPLGAESPALRRHFAPGELPHLYVAEAGAPCGCGFPEVLPGRKARQLTIEERATMARLVEVLRPVVRGRPRVQMVLCFVATEEDDVSSGRTVTLGDLTAPDFRFRNLEILTVVKDGATRGREA